MRERVRIDQSGKVHPDTVARVEVIDSTEVNPDARRAISEITEGRHGLRIKLHAKLHAIRLLGLELGMFKEKPSADVDYSLSALVEAVQREAAPLPINDPNAGRVLRIVPNPTRDEEPSG
jgi:hypothetical protein